MTRERIDIAAGKTVAFAKAMREADPTIALIGWGDSGWAPRMMRDRRRAPAVRRLSPHVRSGPGAADSPLQGIAYRKDPARTWEHLMNAARVHERTH